MARNKSERDPLPEQFRTLDELVEFWDAHDTEDYPEAWREVHFNIKLDKDEFVAVRPSIARELQKRASQRKISVDELVNRMLEEKLREPA